MESNNEKNDFDNAKKKLREEDKNMSNISLFEHPQLGNLYGIDKSPVLQFQSIPYAIIPENERLKHSILLDHIPENHSRVFNKRGPIQPQDEDYFAIYSGQQFPEDDFLYYNFNEYDSLILTVSIPKDVQNIINNNSNNNNNHKGKKLPVLVYIHGGGFETGGGASFAKSDNSLYVKRSIELGKPIIYVSIQYRLGVFGFLTGKTIASENVKNGSPIGNFGFHDQQNALKWIHKFISGFGGDPNNITILGESAGSMSCYFHCLSPSSQGLFSQAAFLSGLVFPQGNLEEAEIRYQSILKKLNIPFELSETEKLKRLRNVSTTDLFNADKAVGSFTLSNILSGDTQLDPYQSFEEGLKSLVKNKNIKSILTSLMNYEGYSFWSLIFNNDNSTKLISQFEKAAIKSGIDVKLVEQLLKDYNVSSNLELDILRRNAGILYGDLLFSVYYNKLDKLFKQDTSLEKKYYRLNFDHGTPVKNSPSYGYATHALDLSYIFLTYNQPPIGVGIDKQIQDEYSARLIDFVYGQSPWKEYSHDNVELITDNGWEEKTIKQFEEDPVHRHKSLSLLGNLDSNLIALFTKTLTLDLN